MLCQPRIPPSGRRTSDPNADPAGEMPGPEGRMRTDLQITGAFSRRTNRISGRRAAQVLTALGAVIALTFGGLLVWLSFRLPDITITLRSIVPVVALTICVAASYAFGAWLCCYAVERSRSLAPQLPPGSTWSPLAVTEELLRSAEPPIVSPAELLRTDSRDPRNEASRLLRPLDSPVEPDLRHETENTVSTRPRAYQPRA